MHSPADRNKLAIIIAGPNGAGKTTWARQTLPSLGCRHFINADLIAAGIAPLNPEAAAIRAGALMLELVDERAKTGESFAVETTLSGRTYLKRLREWRNLGYHTLLVFLALPSADAAVERVALRVRQGGHAIPEDVIRRRFVRGRENFDSCYKHLVHEWAIYNNSAEHPRLAAHGTNP